MILVQTFGPSLRVNNMVEFIA